MSEGDLECLCVSFSGDILPCGSEDYEVSIRTTYNPPQLVGTAGRDQLSRKASMSYLEGPVSCDLDLRPVPKDTHSDLRQHPSGLGHRRALVVVGEYLTEAPSRRGLPIGSPLRESRTMSPASSVELEGKRGSPGRHRQREYKTYRKQ